MECKMSAKTASITDQLLDELRGVRLWDLDRQAAMQAWDEISAIVHRVVSRQLEQELVFLTAKVRRLESDLPRRYE